MTYDPKGEAAKLGTLSTDTVGVCEICLTNFECRDDEDCSHCVLTSAIHSALQSAFKAGEEAGWNEALEKAALICAGRAKYDADTMNKEDGDSPWYLAAKHSERTSRANARDIRALKRGPTKEGE